MPECRKLGTVHHGPACGCPENACVLEADDQQWPYSPDAVEGSVDDTLDENLENERPLESWTLQRPGAVKLHQRSFSVPPVAPATEEEAESMWQASKDAALYALLEDNGLRVTYDQYFDQIADRMMGRWTLEETS